ncbi:hypothetical protein FEM33_20415 [Dyadobacter flavalbus]|uniref:Uncharacterized protein n=1 Tax=Dyadobacter flavalbus TaxID=2579942 RepID=A0A5M8QSB6_9BACT|nr:hypothetical protein [Dyadobacter flavalbus]KAA6437082.1 hypothetical protein FEM33_20415 [Dyadobacter flavalbus]
MGDSTLLKVDKIKIVVPKTLLSAQFFGSEKDELARIFNLWRNVIHLEEFFEENYSDLSAKYYNIHSVEEAVFKTIEQATSFRNLIIQHANSNNENNLSKLFVPYHNSSVSLARESSKAKNSWLRIYAIRLDYNLFIVSGGAIKLTRRMDRNHLQIEDKKMKILQAYLKANHIDSGDDYGYIDLV